MTNWTAIGALATAGSVFIGLLARYIQEDLKRTRLRYYLRPMKAPEGHRASILTVVNTGRSTARNVLVYISPRHPGIDEPPTVTQAIVATDEKKEIGQSPNRNDLIVRFPELHPSDRFNVLFAWKGGAEVFTKKQKNSFRISYEYGTSNKLFRMFGRVHRFWFWQRCREARNDARNPPMFNSKQENPSQIELHISIDLVAAIKEKIK